MTAGQTDLRLERTGRLSWREWANLAGEETAPFGERTEALRWRPKDVHLVYRDGEGRPMAAIGATIATVTVESQPPFPVVGIGSLIVRPELRGAGVSARLNDAMAELARTLGPDRSMCFCEPELVEVYARWDYREIEDPVWVGQPIGPVRMPLRAMWRPYRPVRWPRGVVRVHGLPF